MLLIIFYYSCAIILHCLVICKISQSYLILCKTTTSSLRFCRLYLPHSSHRGGNLYARTNCRNPRKTCPPPWRRPRRRDWWRSAHCWTPATSSPLPPLAASWVSWWRTRENLAAALEQMWFETLAKLIKYAWSSYTNDEHVSLGMREDLS